MKFNYLMLVMAVVGGIAHGSNEAGQQEPNKAGTSSKFTVSWASLKQKKSNLLPLKSKHLSMQKIVSVFKQCPPN